MKGKTKTRGSKASKALKAPEADNSTPEPEVHSPIPYKVRADAYPPHKELSDSPVYETMNSAALAAIPATIVAQVAAGLPGTLRPVERVRTAYQLLDMATFVSEMISKREATSCYNSALNFFEIGSMAAIVSRTTLSPGFSRLNAECLPDGWQGMDSFKLNKHRVPLDTVMGSIFGRSVPNAKRRAKFDEYLEGQWEGSFKASEWEDDGVPLIFFHECWLAYPHWREQQTSESRSKARKGKTKKEV